MSAISHSYRIARHLLIRGASRKTMDKNGKTPLELALERESYELVNILVYFIQKKPSILQKCNPCKSPLNNYPYYITSGSIFAISFTLFIILSCKNPGFVKHTESSLGLYETYRPEYICPYCKVKKLKTTQHCHHCNKCVKVSNK